MPLDFFPHTRFPAPRFLLRMAALSNALSAAQLSSWRHVIEVGPGLGDAGEAFLSHPGCRTLELFEYSPAAASHLRARFDDDPRVIVHEEDFLAAGVERRCDLLLAFEVLEHITDDLACLRGFSRALRSGGHLIVSVPAYRRKWQAVDVAAGHVRRYEKSELADKLTEAGFKILALHDYGWPLTALLYPVREGFYRRRLARARTPDLQAATQNSGLVRAGNTTPIDLWKVAMAPFFVLQFLARRRAWGDGLLAICRR